MDYWKPENALIYEFWQCCHIQRLDEVQTVEWVGQKEG